MHPCLSLRCKAPAAERRVASEFICHKCSREINVWRKLRGMTRVFGAMCNAPYHESCMGKGAKMVPCLALVAHVSEFY